MQIPHPQQNSSYICFTEIFLADIAILKPRRNERERERERERDHVVVVVGGKPENLDLEHVDDAVTPAMLSGP
jgi:hypothetical protein